MNQLSILFFILSIFINTALQAQDYSKEFGIISKSEWDLTTYEEDTDAAAVILFDKGESVFVDTRTGYDIQFTRTKRIKILKRAGTEYAEISIPFYEDGYGKTERISSIKAFTYNFENGQVVKKKLDKKTVFEEQLSKRWRAKKFVFPDVQEGSIIEYEYVLDTPFHFNLPDWEFQSFIPTVYSHYIARLIPFYEYVFLAQGIRKFDEQEVVESSQTRIYQFANSFKFTDVIYTYVMKDVPAFKDESYITSASDYLMKIDFQLSKFNSPSGDTRDVISTWPKLIENLNKHEKFGRYIKSSKRQAEKILVDQLDLAGKTDLQKSKIIIDYVKSNFNWNNRYSYYASKSPKNFIKQKSGNSAEINLFLLALLKAADIEAQAVILSTRNHGKIKFDYPFEHFFNYVVLLVTVDGRPFLTDGTEELTAHNRLPLRCINEKGLVIDKGEPKWVGLENNIPSIDFKNIQLKINPSTQTADITLSINATEFEAYAYKNAFHNDSSQLKKYFLDHGLSAINTIKTRNYSRSHKAYVIALKGEAALEKLGNKIIVAPFLNFPMQENTLTQEHRSYPVDFVYAKTEEFKTSLTYPAGFEVLSLPKNYELNNEWVDINLTYEQHDNKLDIKGKYAFKKAVYSPEEYEKLKSYMDIIVEKFNTEMVFQAIKN